MAHISIQTTSSFLPERKYLFDYIFKTSLGLNYSVIHSNEKNYQLKYNNVSVTIEDHFFSAFNKEAGYIDESALPDVHFSSIPYYPEKECPVLYGSPYVTEEENHVVTGLDVFGGIFFYLSCLEEYINQKRDKHGRFLYSFSSLRQYNILHRPVVCEYIDFLRNVFLKCGIPVSDKKKGTVNITFDIDHISVFRNFFHFTKTQLHNLILKRSISAFQSDLHQYISYLTKKRDKYYTFDFIIEALNKADQKATFYCMSANRTRFDKYSVKSKVLQNAVSQILRNGHIIGYHPAYDTDNDERKWLDDKSTFEKRFQYQLKHIRHHYLKYSLPECLDIWEKGGIKTDSSIGFPDHEGYKCGTGDPFPLFDAAKRKMSDVVEIPLIIMDVTLRDYRHYSIEKALSVLNYYLNISKKYGSTVTVLFHNHNFVDSWQKWNVVFEHLISEVANSV